jgi:arylsulfatase A-like enzyme
LAAVLLLLVAGCVSAAPVGPRIGARPNIVFILTDDLSMNLLPHLPAVLRMERSGTTMSRFYVADSLCCPSRAATLTGEYPHNDGVFKNGGAGGGFSAFNAHNDELRTFSVALRHIGYRTGFMGKYLNGYHPRTHGVPSGWTNWDGVGWGYPEFNYTMNDNGETLQFGSKPKDYLTDVLADKATEFIDGANAADNPFFLEVATFAPHSPYVPAPRYRNADATVKLPRTRAFDRLPTNPPSWLAGHPALTAAQTARQQQVYLQRVRADLAVNDLINRVLNALQRNCLLRDTYIVFSSDNGLHLGEHRLTAGKETAFDTDIHVPLVVMGPGVPAGRTDHHLASNIDLAPTFENIAGVRPPASVDGTSLLGVWHGANPHNWQRAVLVEHRRPPSNATDDPDLQSYAAGYPPTYAAARTDTALLVRYASGELEYYRTDVDPYELHNLGASAAPPALISALDGLARCKGASSCQRAAQLTRGSRPPASRAESLPGTP